MVFNSYGTIPAWSATNDNGVISFLFSTDDPSVDQGVLDCETTGLGRLWIVSGLLFFSDLNVLIDGSAIASNTFAPVAGVVYSVEIPTQPFNTVDKIGVKFNETSPLDGLHRQPITNRPRRQH